MKYFFIPLLLLLPTFTFSQHTGSQVDIDQILANGKAFSQAVMDSDYDGIMSFYTQDAKIFPGKRDIMTGQENIRNYWVMPEGVSTVHHKLTAVEIKVLGDEAYDYGYYEGTTRRADGSESSWRGKYVVIWKIEDAKWKMYLDIWNSIED